MNNRDPKPGVEKLSSRLVYENKWMKLTEDVVRRRVGSQGIYSVVDKKDYVVIAPLEDGYLHLVEQFRYPVAGRFWEFPQGSWESPSSESMIDVARGELQEEVGFDAKSLVEVGYLFQAYGYSNQGFRLYLATGLSPQAKERDREELDLVSARFEIGAVARMINEGVIRDVTTVAAFGLLKSKGLL
jgi:ADP-ribose pyrophosphatase